MLREGGPESAFRLACALEGAGIVVLDAGAGRVGTKVHFLRPRDTQCLWRLQEIFLFALPACGRVSVRILRIQRFTSRTRCSLSCITHGYCSGFRVICRLLLCIEVIFLRPPPFLPCASLFFAPGSLTRLTVSTEWLQGLHPQGLLSSPFEQSSERRCCLVLGRGCEARTSRKQAALGKTCGFIPGTARIRIHLLSTVTRVLPWKGGVAPRRVDVSLKRWGHWLQPKRCSS